MLRVRRAVRWRKAGSSLNAGPGDGGHGRQKGVPHLIMFTPRYPTFWDDLESGLGLVVRGCRGGTAGLPGNASLQSLDASARRESSIVLIGMRGAGKSTLGKTAATKLQWARGRDKIHTDVGLDQSPVSTPGHAGRGSPVRRCAGDPFFPPDLIAAHRPCRHLLTLTTCWRPSKGAHAKTSLRSMVGRVSGSWRRRS